jgi:hypothetical protein
VAGWYSSSEENSLHGKPEVSFRDYLASGDFHESVAENWESEFLQMGMFVLLTVYLIQKGSSESKDPDKKDAQKPTRKSPSTKTPWPVKRGGFVLWLYSHSLSLSLFLLFGISFLLHIVGGWEAYSDELVDHHRPPVSLVRYAMSSRFWFESLQNWQSEFLAIFVMVLFSIYLREKGSPQSKPVDAPHSQTGE